MINGNGPTYAVTLAGGASQGAYHVGVLKALFEGESPATYNPDTKRNEPLNPQVISGTSAGAFNAAALLSQLELEHPRPVDLLETAWLDRIGRTGTSCGNGVFRVRGDVTKFVDPGCLLTNPLVPLLNMIEDVNFFAREGAKRGRQFLTSTHSLNQRLLDQVNVSTFVSLDPFRAAIEDSIRFDLVQRARNRFIRVGAVNWNTGALHYFRKEDMTVDVGPKIIQASAAVPGIFPRVDVNGEPFGDGGVVDNTPLQGAIRANADVIHVITSHPRVVNIPIDETVNTVDTLYRMLVIQIASTLNADIEWVRNVNNGLRLLELVAHNEDQLSDQIHRQLLKTLDRITRRAESGRPYRNITIHVHNPSESLGGLLEFLNFDRENLNNMIRRGYNDAARHNCQANGCVLAD